MLASNPYCYRRRFPHLQRADATIFATFCKLTREPFSPRARDLVLDHCVYEHALRIELYVAVIMPERAPAVQAVAKSGRLACSSAQDPAVNQGDFGVGHQQSTGNIWSSLAGRIIRSRRQIG
jgi:hypothetical protein